MKLQFCIYFILLLTLWCHGQSDNQLKFHLTKERLLSLDLDQKEQDSTKKDTTSSEVLINFNPVISLINPNTNFQILKDVGELVQVTIFTVYQSKNAMESSELWGIYNQESKITLTTKDITYGDKKISFEEGAINVPVLNTYVQSYSKIIDSVGTGKPHVKIGSFSGNSNKIFQGDLAEILLFNRLLSGDDRQLIETYLGIKYGITLNNGMDYISSKKKEIYDIDNNPNYINRIAGIGRDDATGLYQKQSHSSEGSSIITIAIGALAGSNKDNVEEFADGNYLVWGDNNLDSKIEETSEYMSSVPTMDRVWNIQATGELVSELNSTLELNLSLFNNVNENYESQYLLVIDRSGEATFLSENTEYFEASESTNETISFKNLKWDTDGSGSDVFTFGLKKPLIASLDSFEAISCETGKGKLIFSTSGGLPPYEYQLVESNEVKASWSSLQENFPENVLEDLSEGVYILKVTDKDDNQIETSYDLEAPVPINIDLGPDKQFSWDSNEISLDATFISEDYITYNWTSDNGFHSNRPSITVSEPGIYTVMLTSSRGCKASDSIKLTESDITALKIFPNQSKDGYFHIKMRLKEPQNVSVHVFDMLGRKISTFNYSGKSYYEIKEFISASGVYNVMVQSKNLKTNKKLVVE
ncbi:T9SS type A sorting domain-containing protein [Gaetbulibacter sp. M240]|uniref:T9SS type A sorting domain-containing protein n=1 Tax=Gaetbulibacter sp. M240 TaxID=3126511 RepID=UPI00374FA3B2